jgi:hypothetical protein
VHRKTLMANISARIFHIAAKNQPPRPWIRSLGQTGKACQHGTSFDLGQNVQSTNLLVQLHCSHQVNRVYT